MKGKPLRIFRNLYLTLLAVMTCFPGTGCAGDAGAGKAPQGVFSKLAHAGSLDLVVEFDDSAIEAQAARFNRARGIVFDDKATLQFKTERYAALKSAALSGVSAGSVEIIKKYDRLPLLLLRVHSTEALKKLLANPLVTRVHCLSIVEKN
jgi:hypothetical protein